MQDYTGLGAIAWEVFSGSEPSRDHSFFKRILTDNPGLALDVGCGSGRLLLDFIGAGHAVEGVEPSADMRAIIARNAAEFGLEPIVYDQMMQALDLPHTYGTILVPCGSFQLVVDRDQAFETLRRFHAHLEPGGVLALILYNMLGIVGARFEGPGDWGLRARQQMPDGTELQKHARLDGLNKLDQTLDSTLRYRRLRGDEVVEEQLCNGDIRWYFMHEMTLMLERAGFSDIRVTGSYTDAPPTEDDDVFAFVATK